MLSRRLYPRALPLGGEPTEADLQVLSQLVHQEKRRKDQAIGVGFGDDAAEEAASDAVRHSNPPVDDDATSEGTGHGTPRNDDPAASNPPPYSRPR